MPTTVRIVPELDRVRDRGILVHMDRNVFSYNRREIFDTAEYMPDRDATRLTRHRSGWFDFRKIRPNGERIMPQGHADQYVITEELPVGAPTLPERERRALMERAAEMQAESMRQLMRSFQNGADRYAPANWWSQPSDARLAPFRSRGTQSARMPERIPVVDRSLRLSDFDTAWVERTLLGKSDLLAKLYSGEFIKKKKVDYSKASVIYTEDAGPKLPNSDKFLKDEFPLMFKQAYGLVEGPN